MKGPSMLRRVICRVLMVPVALALFGLLLWEPEAVFLTRLLGAVERVQDVFLLLIITVVFLFIGQHRDKEKEAE